MSSRGEGDVSVDVLESIAYTISIHALRMEGDPFFVQRQREEEVISIHALRVEGDSKNGQNFRLFLRKRGKNLPF